MSKEDGVLGEGRDGSHRNGRGLSCFNRNYRLRVVVADASLYHMETVLALLELHEIVDLLGRAANFEETIESVVNHQPDLVLLDLDVPSANLIIPAIIISTKVAVRVVGMSACRLVHCSVRTPLMF